MDQKDQLEYLKGKFDILEQFCMASALQTGTSRSKNSGEFQGLILHLEELDAEFKDVATPRDLGMKDEIGRLKKLLLSYSGQTPIRLEEIDSPLSPLA